MSDWEVVESQPQQNNSDWEAVSQPSAAAPISKNAALRNMMIAIMSGDAFDPQHKMPRTLGQMVIRAAPIAAEDAANVAKNIVGSVVKGVPATLNQAVSDPARAGKNVLAGVGGIIPNLINMGMDVPAYIEKLASGGQSKTLEPYTPQIPVEKYQEKFVGGEPRQSDIDIRNLAGNLPILIPGVKGIAKGVVPATKATGKAVSAISNKATAGMIPGRTDPILEANELQLELRGKGKEAELQQKTQEAEAATQAHQEALAQAKQEIGKSDADLMQYNVNKRQQDIEGLNQQTAALKDQLAATKPEENALPQAEENLNTAQAHQQNAENLSSNIDSNISQFLNAGAQHDVRFSQGLTHRINAIEDYANDTYKTLMQNIADAQFQMPKEAMSKLDYDKQSQLIKLFSGEGGADAFEAMRKGKLDQFLKKQDTQKAKEAIADNPYFQNLMEVAPTAADTNAADFLAKYKSFRDRTFKLSRRWADPRVEEVEKQKMGAALEQARKMQAQMKEVLDAGLGEYKAEFERANKLYSEQVYPLRANPIVEKAAEGKNSSNIIHDLRTNEEGMPLVREIVKQDPELLRNVVGQRYFAKPEEVHNPNETMREYLGEMPQLQQFLREKESANTAMAQAKANVEKAKQHHAETLGREEESAKMQKKIDDMTAKVAEHQAEIPRIQKHIDRLTETAKKKNISLKAKMETERELKALRKQLKDATAKLDDSMTGLRKLYRVAKTAIKIGRKVL